MLQPKLTIFFVTNNYTPYSGGVVSSIQATTNELRNRGHTVQIATLDFLGKEHNDHPYVHRIPCPIKFSYKTNPMALPWRSTHNLLAIAKELRPDIIHVHHPFLLGSSALSVARTLQIPIVFTYHTMYEYYAYYVPLPTAATRWALQRIVPAFCRQVNGIIAPSKTISSMLNDLKLDKPIIVLPSSLQEPFLPAPTYKKKPIHQKFNLLHVGRLVKEKNIPFIIDLMTHLPHDRFMLTMIGYGAAYEELRSYAYEHLSQDQIRFIHKPEKNIIATAYKEADLFLFPSFSDTQALVLAESMAAGTPVIAVDGPGQRDIIVQDHNGYIVHNAEEMIAGINRIAYDRMLHEKLQYNAWETAHSYAPDRIITKLLEFYRTIMETA